MSFERFSRRETTIMLGLALAYLLWTSLVVGLRTDHFVFLGLCLTLFFASGTTRKVFLSLAFFAIYWVIYDAMRVLPNYEVNPVHVQQPYELEKAWFGFEYLG